MQFIQKINKYCHLLLLLHQLMYQINPNRKFIRLVNFLKKFARDGLNNASIECLFIRLILLVHSEFGVSNITKELSIHSLWKPNWNISALLNTITVVLMIPVMCAGILAFRHLERSTKPLRLFNRYCTIILTHLALGFR